MSKTAAPLTFQEPPGELVEESCTVALRCDRTTRGQARGAFTAESGIDFTEIRVVKRWYRDDAELRAEMLADGEKEPYDGWPLRECKSSHPHGAAFWVFANFEELTR